MDKYSKIEVFKPDAKTAMARWQAYYAGELIDRPVVCVTAPRDGCTIPPSITYHEKVFGDVEDVLRRGLAIAGNTFWGGDAFPTFYPSIGPDEIAVFTGAQLRWSADSPDTNWSLPFVEDWDSVSPLELKTSHPMWVKQQALYRRAAEMYAGRILLVAPDLHTNMDLLAAARGPQRLCTDLVDRPEQIDRAMLEARAVFRDLWSAVVEAGRMNHYGYCQGSHGMYSAEGSATLQCDFSIMIGPEMFRHWVLPALEEEAELVKNVVYHWDGPGALVHRADILACGEIHTLSFVPGAGNGDPADHVELLREFQEAGKAVHVWGTVEQCKFMHRRLDPERTFYVTQTATQAEAEDLLAWYVKST